MEGGEIVQSLPTLHNPDVAVSRNGRHLFVIHSNLDKHVAAPDRDELLVYDTATLEVIRKAAFTWRSLYNIAPSGPSIVCSDDGRFVFVNKTETLGDDAANNTMSIFDIEAGAFQEQEIRLPYQATNFGTVPGKHAIHFALSGRLGDAVAYVDLDEGLNITTKHEFGEEHVMRRRLAGSGVHPSQPIVYVVSRDGHVQRWDLDSDSLGEPVKLDLEQGSAVPIPHVIAADDYLLIGVSGPESAARGLSVILKSYKPEKKTGSQRTWIIDPPAEKIALAPDHKQIVTLNRTERMISSYDLATGDRIARLTEIGISPVSFVTTQ
jgi:hypothetical protein